MVRERVMQTLVGHHAHGWRRHATLSVPQGKLADKEKQPVARLLLPSDRSARLYFDTAGPSLFEPRYSQAQHTIFQIGVDLRYIQIHAQREAATEARLWTLDVMHLQVAGRGYHCLSLYAQVVIVNFDIDLIPGNTGQIHPQRDAVAVLFYIDWGRACQRLGCAVVLPTRHFALVSLCSPGNVVHRILRSY